METLMGATREPIALRAALAQLRARPLRWLVTGSAGFIGSHLVEALLRLGQHVVSVDNFETGYLANLEEVRAEVGEDHWRRHQFLEADIVDPASCRRACKSVDIVLHQAALGSVPRSINDPLRTHATNATGFLNMLVAARDAGVSRFVYAASSSTYGDAPDLPKVEDRIGRPLSPYAVTKYVDEIYADVFGRCYGTASIGLRYFNVFGSRQDPEGAYAAVIPRWVDAMLHGAPIVIYGAPCLIPKESGVAEVLRHALLVDFWDVDEMANKVAGILQYPALWEELSDAGMREVHDPRLGLEEALPWYEARLHRPAGLRVQEIQRVDDVT